MMVAATCEIIGSKFYIFLEFFLVFEVVDGRGRDAVAAGPAHTHRCTEFLAIHYTWDHAGEFTAVACL